MPKENKSTSRRNQRQSSEVDHESTAASSTCESMKSAIKANRYSPFPREVPRRDIKLETENMILPSTEIVPSASDGIIGSGIKYIMFPLHLLRFCIFGTTASEKKKEMQQTTANDQTEKAEEKRKEEKESEKSKKNRDEEETRNFETLSCGSTKKARESSSSTGDKQNSKEKVSKGNSEESTDEIVTPAEESDSSVDHWSSASSTMNMSVDYDNVDKSMACTALEEPMDISFEEQAYEKSHLAIRTLESSREAGNFRTNTTKNQSLKAYAEDQDSNSSVDEEIARIFQKQCTSSEDEVSISNSKYRSLIKREKKNFLCNRINDRYSTSASRTNKESESNERGRKKKTFLDTVVDHKRRKMVDGENREEKRSRERIETKTRQEKRELRQNNPQKSKSRVSKTQVQNKESKRKDVKYKEIATQTDSAFSDEDVEMMPVETTLIEKQLCCKYAPQRLQSSTSQSTAMEQELYPVARNENSRDGCSVPEHKLMSSSSTDLCFDGNTDVAIRLWCKNSSGSMNAIPLCSRAPPGFPELPQNPPLTSYDCNNPKSFMKTVLKNSCSNLSIVPPAPSPMRHLYYEYPEFMDFPVNINSSKLLSKIIRHNYYL